MAKRRTMKSSNKRHRHGIPIKYEEKNKEKACILHTQCTMISDDDNDHHGMARRRTTTVVVLNRANMMVFGERVDMYVCM